MPLQICRTGYSFNGWNTAANGGGTHYAASANFTYIETSDVTLYAEWAKNSYALSYSENGGTGSVPAVSGNHVYASPVTVLGNTGGITKTGYTFAGWNTVYDGSGTSYSADDTFSMPAAAVTLYAEWTIKSYSLSYDGNKSTGGTEPTATNWEYNSTAAVSGNTGTLVRLGYKFDGWNTKSDGTGTTSYLGNGTESFTMGAADVTLYAKWTVNSYIVTFDSQSGSPVASSNVEYGGLVIKPTDPTRVGCIPESV